MLCRAGTQALWNAESQDFSSRIYKDQQGQAGDGAPGQGSRDPLNLGEAALCILNGCWEPDAGSPPLTALDMLPWACTSYGEHLVVSSWQPAATRLNPGQNKALRLP